MEFVVLVSSSTTTTPNVLSSLLFSEAAIFFLLLSLCVAVFASEMATGKADGKRRLNYYDMEEEEEEEEEEEDGDGELGFGGDFNKKKKIVGAGSNSNEKPGSGYGGGTAAPSCQVDNCNADLSGSKRYHRRHKVCEFHAKAPAVAVAGIHRRFCQQCSRFHGLQEFDESKRSCRKRLAGHNQRRRKSSSDGIGESST